LQDVFRILRVPDKPSREVVGRMELRQDDLFEVPRFGFAARFLHARIRL
jgi:hypothetical protein